MVARMLHTSTTSIAAAHRTKDLGSVLTCGIFYMDFACSPYALVSSSISKICRLVSYLSTENYLLG